MWLLECFGWLLTGPSQKMPAKSLSDMTLLFAPSFIVSVALFEESLMSVKCGVICQSFFIAIASINID